MKARKLMSSGRPRAPVVPRESKNQRMPALKRRVGGSWLLAGKKEQRGGIFNGASCSWEGGENGNLKGQKKKNRFVPVQTRITKVTLQ